MLRIYVGYDPREADAYRVCVSSLRRRARHPVAISPLLLPHLQARGLYRRPMEMRCGQRWDRISDAPMSTEFSLTRFLVPSLADRSWALFVDCDFLFRADVAELFALRDARMAVQVVKHVHVPAESLKMDGQVQTHYARKNWSSCVLWNLSHPAHERLTLNMVNGARGIDLHRFSWLADDQIGDLPEAWNWLEGYSDPAIEPKAVHFTRGTPDMPGYQGVAYADEWRAALAEVGA